MENTDYKKDMNIDPQALEVEWLRQSSLYMNYAEKCAMAERRKNSTKEQLEVIKAECDREIRARKIEAKEKVTESIIEAAIVDNKKHKEGVQLLLTATYEHNILSFVIKALEHRKKALENLVQLYLSGYFSGPKEPRNGESIREKIMESTQSKQRAGLKKRSSK